MVLWEITLGTAYFLGLKRTYKLALRIQRRIISTKHPKIRQFAHRRTRAAFDLAVRFHKNIQERDIEVGRNFGNWILRWLDRMKPSAQIRTPEKLTEGRNHNITTRKRATSSSQVKRNEGMNSGRHLFTSLPANMWAKSFPTISTIMRTRSAAKVTSYRNFSEWTPRILKPNHARIEANDVFRKDIMQWMLQN